MRVCSGAAPIANHGMREALTYGKHYGHAGKGGHAGSSPRGLRVQKGGYMLTRTASKLP